MVQLESVYLCSVLCLICSGVIVSGCTSDVEDVNAVHRTDGLTSKVKLYVPANIASDSSCAEGNSFHREMSDEKLCDYSAPYDYDQVMLISLEKIDRYESPDDCTSIYRYGTHQGSGTSRVLADVSGPVEDNLRSGKWLFFNDRGFDTGLYRPSVLLAWTKTYEGRVHVQNYLHLDPGGAYDLDDLTFPSTFGCFSVRGVNQRLRLENKYIRSVDDHSACISSESIKSFESQKRNRRLSHTEID